MYTESLKSVGALAPAAPKVFASAERVMPSTIEPKMRLLMIANELVTFAGHLRKNIAWQGASIPVNSIGLLIGESGRGKGLALSSIQNILKPAFKLIEESRAVTAKRLAVIAAEEAGKPETKWRDFYSKPRDLIVAISTLPGWVKHLNGLEAGTLGSGTLYVDELSSELASSKDLMELLTSLSILYDTGHLPVKALKSDENQGKTVNNLPVSALLFGSPHGMLFDEKVKKKFLDEASSKLARRVICVFSTDKPSPPKFNSIQESRDFDKKERERINQAAAQLSPWFTALVTNTTNVDLTVDDEVQDIFSDYRNYNDILASAISLQHPLAKIHRQHRQWAALKISGALAILEGFTNITSDHFIQAINFTEMFVDDLSNFETELNKESYELASDYLRSISENGMASLSTHKLRKLGFIKGPGNPKAKLIDLVDLIRSYDSINTYQVGEGHIHFFEEAIADSEDYGELE